MLPFVLLFTLMPLAELAVLVKAGTVLGLGATVGLCILTGIVGAALARNQGAGVLRRMQATVQSGGLPARELADGALILVAGVVLLTPGFITDAIGLLLLLPPTRAVVRVWLMRRLAGKAQARFYGQPGGAQGFYGHWQSGPGRPGPRPRQPSGADGDVVLYGPEDAPPMPRPKPPRVIDVD